jgi:protochlorophyllide reductase
MVKNKNILITGGNSGIGFYATINLLNTKNNLYVVIKSELRKHEFLKKIEKHFDENYLNKYLNIIENCDLADLDNIKKIKDYFINKNIFLDVVVLNAGLQYTGSFYPKVSKQGLELTFAVNHLAHFYLVNVLKDFVRDKDESRIIITSSDVHDPKSSGGNIGKKAGLNNLVDFRKKITGQFLNFNADESYKNSKLCNILFAKELVKKFKISSIKISVITWAPGLVIPNDDSGFFRYSKVFNLFGYLIFSKVAKNILGISESTENAGKILSEIVLDSNLNNVGYIHLSNKLISFRKHKLVENKISDEANSAELASKLWILSEEICKSFGFVSFNI